jgi:hypothetical protein
VHHDSASAGNRLVLVDTGPATGLALLPQRRRDRWLARLRHRSLDARLAAGESPESTRLLAVRAMQLVRPAARRRIAGRWDKLATETRLRQRHRHPELADHIEQVAVLLRTDEPVGARGVANAITMLRVAADAVQRVRTGGDDIAGAAARTALATM